MAEVRGFIGVDPGPIPGLVRLVYSGTSLARVDVVQCSPKAAAEVLHVFMRLFSVDQVSVQVERLVDSARSGRTRNRADLDVTREVVADVVDEAAYRRVPAYRRRAVDVKPWATDARLEAAGLLGPTTGMRHARDAARHALFLACTSGMPDPLSSR